MPNPVAGTVVPVGALVTPAGGQGTQGAQGPIKPGPFVLLSAAYSILPADSGKYFICSGGSYQLTLPPAAVGLAYWVRNDMGITGTTGIITLAAGSGSAIEGVASTPLLAGQECTIVCDGTNWRVFGRQRYVVLGTQEITTPQASGIVLLPAGYRYFELEFTRFQSSATNDYVAGQFSTDGGNTWQTTGYYHGLIYNNTATAMATQDTANGGYFYALASSYNAAPYGMGKLTVWPGAAGAYPNWTAQTKGYLVGTSNFHYQWIASGLMSSGGFVNALKYYGVGGNITSLSLTVTGVA